MTQDRSRRLAAIWFADIAGFTRLSGHDEDAALALVEELQALAAPLIEAHGGRLVKFVGDAVLATFESTDGAVRSGLELQKAFAASEIVNRHSSGLRIGVHVGEIVEAADGDVYGDGVNVASRIQSVARSGAVVASESAARHLENRSDFVSRSLGSHEFKGVRRPVEVFAVSFRSATEADKTAVGGPETALTSAPFARALSDRYEIERELGSGGMATVYLAEDLKHHRKVAMKVLRPEVAASVGPERFLREIEIAANLSHPHILPLFDSGEAAGFLYYVMPFMEGESLQDRLDREKQLPLDDALEIARRIAGALAYAHERNVIHRDIKPANILLSGNEAVVADFGIAKAILGSGPGSQTAVGITLGTPAYMSPEQIAGTAEIDGRTDTYALACVLYEMLAGQTPFTGPTAESITAQHLTADSPSVRTIRGAAPAEVSEAIQRAMAKTPADRFRTASEFAEALKTGGTAEPVKALPPHGLRRVGLAAGTLVILTAIFLGVMGRMTNSADDPGNGPARESEIAATGADVTSAVSIVPGSEVTYVDLAEDPRPAIAVLPFADMSPRGDQEYFSDGISAQIVTVLSKIRGLRVAARSSALRYKGSDLDPRQIGAELGVPFLLDGTVRKDGDQLRISATLVNTADGFVLWSQDYDRRLERIFDIQTEIAESIADSLRVPLGLSQDELVSPTHSMEAYDLYLSARAALTRRGPGVGEAVTLFQRAVDLDSTWAPAWAGLAESHVLWPLYTGLGRESTDSVIWARSLAAAEVAAHRALDLDPKNASGRVALGNALLQHWEWEEAERELQRALQLDPDNGEAHVQYSELLWGAGRLDESMRESGRALALDRSPLNLTVHGFTVYMNGGNEEAEALLEEGIAMDTAGEMHFLRTVLSDLMLFDGRYREAIDRFAFYLDDTEDFRRMGEALAAGNPALLPESAGRGFAQVLAVLGETDLALDALEDGVFAMPYRVRFEVWDPRFAEIWDTPRFQNVILPRLKLTGAVPSFADPSGSR